MKHVIPAFRMLIWMTILTGIIYPLVVTGMAQVLFSRQANGLPLERGGVVLGSEFVGQNFEGEKYFWPRPSAGSYNPLPSGGSNLGQISADLKKVVDERAAKLKAAHPGQGEPPQDLLFASSSGLDPHISPEAARYQIIRIAKARGLDIAAVSNFVEGFTEKRQFGVLGEPRVNVLKLNLALDQSQGIDSAPVVVPPPPVPAATPAAPEAGEKPTQ